MRKRKQLRTRGKLILSHYFQEFKEGDRVAIVMELGLNPKFPKQIQGRSGVIKSKRGSYYVIKMNDLNKAKQYVIHPAHLRRLK